MTPEPDGPNPAGARRAQDVRRGIGGINGFLAAAARAAASLLIGRLPAIRGVRRKRPHPVEKTAPYPVND